MNTSEYRERPTTKSGYTKQDLIDYAQWRKDRELSDLKAMQEWKNENPDKDIEENEDYREPLSVDKEIELDICLSTGGDADGYKLTYSGNQQDGYNLDHAVYYWADWGVYEEVRLSDEEADAVESMYLYGEPSIYINEN